MHQRNIIENPEIELDLWQRHCCISEERIIFPINGAGAIGYSSHHTQKINSRWLIDLNEELKKTPKLPLIKRHNQESG